jgi:predicted ATPase/DNA-binding SARP family transcriptional activator
MAYLKLFVLGQPRLERDEAPIELNLRKALALLVYLAVTGQAHSRDALATLLWPESDGREGRTRLRRTLHRLAQALGEDLLVADSDTIRLRTAELWLDSTTFRQHVAAGLPAAPADVLAPERLAHLTAAIELYAEDFLAGFTLPDSPVFDEWQFFQRESLHQLYGQALEQLVQAHQSIGAYGNAIGYARRWVALDVLHEPAHRTLMRLYALAGQYAAAARQYQECVRVLGAELGAEPEEQTTALYKAIRTRQVTPPGVEGRPPPVRLAVPQPRPEASLLHEVTPPSHNVPLQLTSFVGRDAELDAITRLLLGDPPQRLLTLVGPGGVGKTRLALTAAERQVRRDSPFPDGVFFVALAPIDTAAGIVPEVATAVRFSFSTEQPPHRQLLEHLRPKRLLLVLDNLEHLLSQEALDLIGSMLTTAPGVTLLITSRARLNVQGEAIFPVGGLPIVPTARLEVSATLESSTDGRSSAVDLFAQRARRVQPDFILTPELLPAVTRICELVQGLPLGIELAAAWADVLAPVEIAAEIERSLDFLAADWRDVPERQQSLRAVFDASWMRLDAAARDTLQALTVFHAPFERQVAQAVAGATIQTIRVLVNESWLQRDTADRFHMQELMRQYVAEILAREPAAWRRCRDRHAAYFAELLHQLDEQMRGSQPQAAFSTMRTVFEDARAAWLWLMEQGDVETLTRQMLPALFRYGELDVKEFAVLPLLEAAQRVVEADMTSRDRELYLTMLLTAQGAFYRNGYPIRAELMPDLRGTMFANHIERAWSIARSRSSWEALGFWGVLLAAECAWTAPDADAGMQQLRRLIGELRAGGRRWDLAFALQSLSRALSIRLPDINPSQPLEEARGYLRESLALFEALGDAREIGNTLRALGSVYLLLQRLPEARDHFEAARRRLAAIDDWGQVVTIQWQLADVNFRLGDRPAAFQHLHHMYDDYLQCGRLADAILVLSRESYEALRYSDLSHARATRERSLDLARQNGDRSSVAWHVWEMGEIERVAGNYTAARLHYEQAHILFADIPDRMTGWHVVQSSIFYHRGLGDIAYACGDPAAAERHFQASLASARENDHDWSAAYALAGLARAVLALQRPDEAREYLYEALTKAQKYGTDGIMMVVLTGIADVYAATGAPEQAHPLASLVVAHPMSWHETKARAQRIQAATAVRLNSSAPAVVHTEPGTLWSVVEHLQVSLAPHEM